MKFRTLWAFVAMMGTALVAFGEVTSTGTASTTGDTAAGTANTVTTTQMTQDDQAITDAVQAVLKEGGYTGITATVAAGTVILKGSVMEDKLQSLADGISKINGVGAVNIDGVMTTKLMPSTPNMPIDKPAPAAGLIAPAPAGSAAE